MNRSRLFCAVLALLVTASASAETVYRRVDADGNVTYSSTPPQTGEKAEAVEIDPDRNVVAPHTSPQIERLEAEERSRFWSRQQQETRQRQDREAQIRAAEERLERARAARETGQAVQPGDLFGKKEGGTRPSLQRIERLERLDQEVRAAEENLERVRRGQ